MRIRPIVSSLATAAIALTALPACGHAGSLSPAAHRQASAVQARSNDLQGCYLAVNFKPTPELTRLSAQLRSQIGFLDMTQAQPPRSGDELHVTVGYFKRLSREHARQLQERFQIRRGALNLTGYGVANKQAAYFAVEGVEQDRRELQGLGLAYEADDAHITFGVSPSRPQDVHNVAKKAQRAIEPLAIAGEYHLMQGSRRIW